MSLIIGLALLIGLVSCFFATYVLNKKTPLPQGIDESILDGCQGCKMTSCKNYKNT